MIIISGDEDGDIFGGHYPAYPCRYDQRELIQSALKTETGSLTDPKRERALRNYSLHVIQMSF